MAKVTLRLVGVSPLLTHSPASMQQGGKTRRGDKVIPTPEEEAALGCYKVGDNFAMPTIGPRNALIKAAGAYKKGKASARGAAAHIVPTEELCIILDANTGKPIKAYEIDTRRAVVQKNGILRSRPKFTDWAVDVPLEYDPQLMPLDLIVAIMEDAGNRIGVGDYRPERTGWFGRFKVKSYKEG